MKQFLYNGIYTLFVCMLFVGSVVLFVSGHTSAVGGGVLNVYADNTDSVLPNLVVAVRDLAIKEGESVVVSKDGIHADVVLIQGSTRVQGGLAYDTGTTLLLVQDAGYRHVASVPLLGVLVLGLSTIWGQLLLLGVPIVMLLTHILLITVVRVRLFRSARKVHRSGTGTSHAPVLRRDTQLHEATPAAPVEVHTLEYDEERNGITELDTIVRPRAQVHGYKVVVGNTLQVRGITL